MNGLMDISGEGAGIMIWIVWLAIGVIAGVVAARFTGAGTKAFDIIIGIASGGLGGYLTTCFVDTAPLQMFLLSVLGAAFFSAAALYITTAILFYYKKKQN